MKRTFDLVLSLAGLALLLPLLLAVALWVKFDSHGPVLFRQERVGRRGRRFRIFKFRTMREGSERGGDLTRDNDARITRVGRFLRRFSVDELPQLINVLRGEMSLVGPRPERPEFVEDLQKNIPFYFIRHVVKPGITGWAQVNFRYGSSKEDAMEKLRFDLYYIRFYSPVLDLEIVLKTVLHVLSVRGR